MHSINEALFNLGYIGHLAHVPAISTGVSLGLMSKARDLVDSRASEDLALVGGRRMELDSTSGAPRAPLRNAFSVAH